MGSPESKKNKRKNRSPTAGNLGEALGDNLNVAVIYYPLKVVNLNTCGFFFSLAHLFNMFLLAGGLYSTNLTVPTKGLSQHALQACLLLRLFQ